MPLEAGHRLGPHEIIAQIGAGGMGEVYKARDSRLDRTVAIKGGTYSAAGALSQRYGVLKMRGGGLRFVVF